MIKYIAKPYTGIYNIHKYWSKKPYNIIRELIEQNSKMNDVILDPFCGSGITINESTFLKRRAIGIDINPISRLLTTHLISELPLDKIDV